MSGKELYSKKIKYWCDQLGFEYCGIAEAALLDEDAIRLEVWLKKGLNAGLQYMENHFDKRIDPRKLVPDAKSVITVLMNYYPESQQNELAPQIAKYAYGNDYHEVIRGKLKELMVIMRQEIGEINGRGFVDSAPVLERSWAVKSGLGWIGKNGNLLNKHSGSFFFIATLIVDIELEYDNPYAKDYCGSCTRCIEACPTNAIIDNKVIDAGKCISYFTIELKDALIPYEKKEAFNNWIFGCDICQDVCPWNRFSTSTNELQFTPIPQILNFTTQQWEELTEESFKEIFKNSPLKRSKFQGIQRNLRFIQT